MINVTSLLYIDFVPYIHFKTKRNKYRHLNEHALNVWLFVLILLDNNYQLLYCILQYAHAGTCNWSTLLKKWRFFWRKKRVNEMYSWFQGFVFRQRFMIKYKSSRFLQEMIVFTSDRKRSVICVVDFTYTRS